MYYPVIYSPGVKSNDVIISQELLHVQSLSFRKVNIFISNTSNFTQSGNKSIHSLQIILQKKAILIITFP